jgi:hypothetical protein
MGRRGTRRKRDTVDAQDAPANNRRAGGGAASQPDSCTKAAAGLAQALVSFMLHS